MPTLKLSDDEQEAALLLAPGERLSSPQALIFLSRQGVRYGHLPRALAGLPDLTGPAEVVVAAAEPAIAPVDGRIDMPVGDTAFPYEPTVAPTGELVYGLPPVPVTVTPGEVVALKVPPVPGRAARTVTGKPLGEPPSAPLDVVLEAGEGAALSPDGLRVTACLSGNASLEHGRVVVRPELRIEGDLTFEHGDVVFDGNVLVEGDVEPGRRIEAQGDVTVLGVVVGAHITAGRRIVVHGGVRNEADLTAGTDLLAQFVETSRVRAGRRVIVREDLTQARVEGAWHLSIGGSVVGGSVQVYERVEARELGSPMAAPTLVAVVPPPPPADPRPALVKERQETATTMQQVWIRIEEAQRVIVRSGAERQKGQEAAEMRDKLVELYQGLKVREESLTRRIAEAAAHEPPSVRPVLLARERIHPGVTVQLAHARLWVDIEYPASVLSEANGAVQVAPFAREPKGAHS